MAYRIPLDKVIFDLNKKAQWRMLGRGSFGTVYAATYAGEAVAIKVFDFGVDACLSPHELDKFWQEADRHYVLRHDHVV